jgi:MFS family permease
MTAAAPQAPAPSETPLPQGWMLRLGVLFMVHVLGMAHLLTVLAMAPVVRVDLGLSATEFGLLVSAYSAAQGFCALPIGWLIDRIGVAAALQLGTSLLIAGSLVLTQAPWRSAAPAIRESIRRPPRRSSNGFRNAGAPPPWA